MAIISVLVLNPERIRLGGAAFAGNKGLVLMEKVRAEFLAWNKDYLPDYRERDAVAQLIELAKFGNAVKVLSALAMGCRAAWPEDRRTISEQKEGADIVQLYPNSKGQP
jgi:hypothetical protein